MTKPSGRGRHSFVQFYMSDWLAGTARMPRLIRSVYFDICCYNWDKMASVPDSELFLMTADLPQGQGDQIIASLIESGQLQRDADGVFSSRAMAEAKRAYEAWDAKSRGGKTRRNAAAEKKDKPLTAEAKHQESSQDSSTEPEPEPELEKKEEVNTSSQKEGGGVPAPAAGDGGGGEVDDEPAKLTRAELETVVTAWNGMAARSKLAQVSKITEERAKRLRARIREHGIEEMCRAIGTVPQSPFLMGRNDRGWKANFDWLLQPESCVKLIEGVYHNRGESGSNGNGAANRNGSGGSQTGGGDGFTAAVDRGMGIG